MRLTVCGLASHTPNAFRIGRVPDWLIGTSRIGTCVRSNGMELGRGVAAELEDLKWHWGGAYDVSEGSGAWRAVRADNQVTLVAASAGELRDLIAADYGRRPVPRA
jgi:hypothetical protein